MVAAARLWKRTSHTKHDHEKKSPTFNSISYTSPKKNSTIPSIYLLLVALVVYVSVSGGNISKLVDSFHNVNDDTILQISKRKPKRKIVLLGPHDRYNFGDLLYEKVLSKLLQTRAGYHDDEIIRGGLISINMTTYGGHPEIISMERVQEMSRNSSDGPFDIIYTGGQTIGCNHDCGVKHLPTNAMQDAAEYEKVCDCAYLFPKELLLPVNKYNKTNGENKSMLNSIGYGFPQGDCRKAVDTADFITYRDHDPMVPDSTVITKELFKDKISAASNEVLKELFPALHHGNTKYIAVQLRMTFKEMQGPKLISETLDKVSKQSKCTIVFFAAGTIPKHDAFQFYHKIASMMKEPNIVYEEEHVWKVIGTIAGAEAVMSTSLNVRIMAFVFHKPRLTWCKREGNMQWDAQAHNKFITKWDASNAPHCVKMAGSWDTLSLYMGKAPEISQEETKLKYDHAVKSYMKSFDHWSNLTSRY